MILARIRLKNCFVQSIIRIFHYKPLLHHYFVMHTGDPFNWNFKFKRTKNTKSCNPCQNWFSGKFRKRPLFKWPSKKQGPLSSITHHTFILFEYYLFALMTHSGFSADQYRKFWDDTIPLLWSWPRYSTIFSLRTFYFPDTILGPTNRIPLSFHHQPLQENAKILA